MEFEFSAGAIVYSNIGGKRKFLMLERDGWLDMPKGHIEEGESSRTAEIRETKEECGLDVVLDDHFKEEVEYWFTEKSEKIKKKVTFYLARAPSEEVKISNEHLGYEWVVPGAETKLKIYKNSETLLEKASEYLQKKEKVEKLNSEYAKLPEKFEKWDLSRNFVPGDGPVNAKIMVIGQAPGRNEDEQGKPFIGMAGKLLTTLLGKAGLKRETVYITSVVQFFPPDNRVPTDEEAESCLYFLKKQIEIIKPKIIVLLGNFATYNVDGKEEVMKIHGKLIESKEYNCYLFITLHPAAAVRMKKFVPLMEKDFEDLKEIIKEKKI